MKFETSWDDGSKYDVRLVELLALYNIPATLYIPIHCDIGLNWVKDVENNYKNIEVGCHTVTHPADIKLMEPDFLEFEVKSAKEMIEVVVGHTVSKFCYPRGRYNDFVKQMVKDAGFTEARTTKVLSLDEGSDLFEKPTSVHAFNRKEYAGVDWYEMAILLFEKARQRNGYFHLWGHSEEIERNEQWMKLEKFFKYIEKDLK